MKSLINEERKQVGNFKAAVLLILGDALFACGIARTECFLWVSVLAGGDDCCYLAAKKVNSGRSNPLFCSALIFFAAIVWRDSIELKILVATVLMILAITTLPRK